MLEPKITALRSIELGVSDLGRSIAFYSNFWGLELTASAGNTAYLRATGLEHHVIAVTEMARPKLLSVHFAAPSKAAVDTLHNSARALGITITKSPAERPKIAGGGYGFSFTTPDGQDLSVSADVRQHQNHLSDHTKPMNLTHVVINSAEVDRQTAFFQDVLGFKLSDSTHSMEFIRCGRDHHSVALARGTGPSLNHMAYEMQDFDGLMYGSGRMKQNGFDLEWGVGRHGPGSNIFSYFIEPDGFVAEYTTGMDHIDEATYVAKDARYWKEFKPRPCRWGMAMSPSKRIREAMSGKLDSTSPVVERCEDVIAKTIY